jgi:hypothetical protein
MRYVCPKCAEAFAVPPPDGTCPHCDAALLHEPDGPDAEQRGESDGPPSPKRRL